MINLGDIVELQNKEKSFGKFKVSKITPTKIYIQGYSGEIPFDRKTGMEIKQTAIINPNLIRYIVPAD